MTRGAGDRLDKEREELIARADRYADLGLGVHADMLRAGGPVPQATATSPMIVDTDVGGDPDDAVALVVAALSVPELSLVITTDELAGERARFARHLLDLCGRTDVAVVAGRQLRDDVAFTAAGLVPGCPTCATPTR
jgi:pyrimidine-specific ribonucleoside hydrolase